MTAQAARRWTTGASGEEGRRRRSGWGLGAAEIGDDGAVGRRSFDDARGRDGGRRRRSGMAELETDGVVGRRDLWRRRSAVLADVGGSEQEARWE